MIQSKGYAAQTVESNLAPWNFERRDVGPHDVQLEIIYCGVCHSDLHQIRNDWFPGIFHMVPGHEIVGKVIQTGGLVKNSKKGIWRVLVAWLIPAGSVKTVKRAWNNIA